MLDSREYQNIGYWCRDAPWAVRGHVADPSGSREDYAVPRGAVPAVLTGSRISSREGCHLDVSAYLDAFGHELGGLRDRRGARVGSLSARVEDHVLIPRGS